MKPGENSNRGQGIVVTDQLETISDLVSIAHNRPDSTFIIQKYIHNPFLIKKRKFDIRIFSIVTCCNNGYAKGYFYNEGYLRTSCKVFTLEDFDNPMIHLTNDAVQVHDEDYGKFEMANKLSFTDFQKYLDTHHEDKYIDFKRDLLPQIRAVVTDTIRAVQQKLDPHKRSSMFEIFGYDFMIDEEFKIHLIEVNTNP